MNLAVFMSLGVLLAKLNQRQKNNYQDRDIKKPIHPVIRDRIVSLYPLSISTFNTTLGAFPLACKSVFPHCRMLGYTLYPYEPSINFSRSEMKEKFPDSTEIGPDTMYGVMSADLTFYKLNIKKRKIQFSAGQDGYDVDPEQKENFKSFINQFNMSKSKDIIIEVSYSRSHARGEEGPQKDRKEISHIIKLLESKSKKLSDMDLYTELIDACDYTGQQDVRLFITTFPLNRVIKRRIVESFVVNLDPVSNIKQHIPLPQLDQPRRSKDSPFHSSNSTYEYKNTDVYKVFHNKSGTLISDKGNHSITGQFKDDEKRYPVQCAKRMQTNPIWRPYLLEDWRLNTEYPILRYFSLGELERLAGFPTGWISKKSSSHRGRALHISSNPLILQYILQSYALHYFNKFKPGIYYA